MTENPINCTSIFLGASRSSVLTVPLYYLSLCVAGVALIPNVCVGVTLVCMESIYNLNHGVPKQNTIHFNKGY